MFIDDIELHSVAELCRLLSYQTNDFRLAADLGKLRIFEKCSDARTLGWWGTQPYIALLQGDRIRRGVDWMIRGMISLRETKRKITRF
jgi:hypothetical protein